MEKFSWKMGSEGAWKMPRTDAFNCPESKMEMGTVVSTVTATETDHQYHLMRNSGRSSSSSCLVSENSNSTASEAIIFGHESSSSESSRLYRSESVPFHLHHYKPAGMPMPLPLCFPPVGREMGMVAAVRSPFSPSQWRELEQQALIFKYMTAGIPVPADLLISFRKSLPPFAGSSPYHHLPHTTLTAWSPFQMGYGGNVDSEPGRCRRTDGKKWRCSRDVVPDQKYCERHMHRGRHRGSRKPVEGPTGTTTSTTSSNLRPGRKDLSFSSDGNQFQHFSVQHAGVGHGGPSATLNETKDCRYLNGIKGEDDILSAKVSSSHEWRVAPKYNGSSPQLKSLMGQQFGLMREGNQAENFNAKQHQHSFLGGCSNRSYGNMQESGQEERPLRHFLDDWPRSDTEETSRSKQNNNSSTTQLSISIPSATNSWSPRGKLSLSPLKLTMSGDGNEEDPIEMDPIEMGLGVGMNMNMDVEERHDRPHSWIPIAWENNPMGMLGPLAEVLQSGGNKPGLNLMEEDINNNNKNNSKSEELKQSPGSCIASSPTGVLQKTFGCVSDTNSAATSKTDSSSQIASS